MSVVGTRVLVLEDDKSLSEILCEELLTRGFRPMPAESVAEATAHLRAFEFDVALLDLMLPDGSGIDILRHLTDEGLATEAIILTGYAQVQTAIEAMKLGAYDYLSKPVRMEEVEVLVQKAAEKASLRRENISLRLRLELQRSPSGIITEDPGMRTLLATLDKVAQSDLPVLIQGESGTGKELVARALHERSDRARQPFVAFNCAAVPDNLIESEMFGYEKGAFTGAVTRKPGLFELADHGVLFLDEIGDLSPPVQVKVLRAVEIREFYRVGGTRSVRLDVRIVSATNKNLKEASTSGAFREDLYFRLNGVTLELPPLRERKGDIALLAAHFLKKAGGKPQSLSRAALQKLEAYAWPGNIRELQMVMRRAAVLASRETLEPDDLPLEAKSTGALKAAMRIGMTLAEVETEYIRKVLDENEGHRGRTAKILGIDAKTLYNKLGPDRPRSK
jgi:two-component system, NtrC family, response regulator AtoC